LDENGKRYCEWIVNVRDCEDEQFFMNLQMFCAAVCFISGILFLICAIMRGIGFQNGLTSCLKLNASFVALIIEVFWFFVYSMMVILNTNKLAIYILWAALYPYTFVPPAFFADTLIRAISKNHESMFDSDTNLKKCSLSNRHRSLTLSISVTYSVALITTLIAAAGTVAIKDESNLNLPNSSLSGDYYDNVDELSHQLVTAATAIHAINLLIITIFFFVSVSAMLKVLNLALRSTSDVKMKDADKHVVLFKWTYTKLREIRFQTASSAFVTAIYFFFLAFYEDFFVNVSCSKAFAVISIGLVPGFFIIMAVVYLITEIKRLAYYLNVQENKTPSLNSARVHSNTGKASLSKEDSTEVNIEIPTVQSN